MPGKEDQAQAELKKCLMNGALLVGSLCATHVDIANIIDESNPGTSQVGDSSTLFGRELHSDAKLGSEVKTLLEAFPVGDTLGAYLKSTNFHENVLLDYPSYKLTMLKVLKAFDRCKTNRLKVPEEGKDVPSDNLVQKKIIGAIANLFQFSSDKTIQMFSEPNVWDVKSVDVPQPALNEMTRVRSKSNLYLSTE